MSPVLVEGFHEWHPINVHSRLYFSRANAVSWMLFPIIELLGYQFRLSQKKRGLFFNEETGEWEASDRK